MAITTSGAAPNAASAGPSGNVAGETWLDGRNTLFQSVLKVHNGTNWVPANGFSVDNANGNFSLARTLTVSTLIVNGGGASSYVRLPVGPSSDEALITPQPGMIRFDSTRNQFRGYNGSGWADVSSGDLASLYVSGDAQIDGTLTVGGNTFLGNNISSDSVAVNATLLLFGDCLVGSTSTTTLTINSSTAFTSSPQLVNQQAIRFHSGLATSSNYVALKAPAAIAANVNWTLPGEDGNPGEFLQTNGAGALTWATTNGQVIREFGQTIAADYTISFNSNAMSVGPVTVAAGVTVTVPANSRYIVI